ncbi:MAG: TolC family protein [Thermoanaerobaculia bacterium]
MLLGLLLAAAPAGAQEVRVTTMAAPPPAEAPALDVKDNAVQLSLDDAVRIALQQNLGLVAERYTRTQRRLGITQSLGIYDLVANATATATDARSSPVTNQVQGSQRNSQTVAFSFTQRTPTGGDLTVGMDAGRAESNSQFSQALAYSPGLTFSYDQPLLRDFGRAFNERNIIIARTNSEISGQEFERQVTLTTQDVVNAYWALVNAREQLGVAQQSLQLARDLHDRNRIQVEVGTMAPLELTQSEAAIATRQEDIIRSTSNVGDAEDNLRRLLNLPAGPLWETPIVPTTKPETERLAINVDQAIQTAYAERPELRQQALQLEQARRDSEYFRNQLKPTLDLHIDYGLSGGDESFSEALSQLYGFDFRTWTAQVRFAYPIQNRAARAQSAIANLDVDRFQTLFDQQRVLISTEVRRAARAVETAAQQIEAARISREFQEKNVEAEKKRYENGMSSSFQITQIQDDLTQARSREVAATVNYRTALAEFYRATGRLLDEHGVAIDDPADPDYVAQRYSFSRAPLPGEVR